MENWESYFCTVEDERAFIVVNLGLASEAPMADYPFLGYVSFAISLPDADGFPAEDEDEALNDLEDALVEAFSQGDSACCAGHCLSDGRFDVYFYLRCAEAWHERVTAVLNGRTSHDWESGSHADAEWELYHEFLFPDDYALLQIHNKRGCAELLEQDDDLERSRIIEHWTAFPERDQASSFISAAGALGYTADEPVLEEYAPEPESDNSGSAGPELSGRTVSDDAASGKPEQASAPEGRSPASDSGDGGMPAAGTPEAAWQVRLSRPDKPADIDDVSLGLFDLAREQGGVYLGWSCVAAEDDAR